MKVAIVHDYIKEFGGAERVLSVLSEIYPNAPIYTAFYDKNSVAFAHFKNKKIITSWFQKMPFYVKLVSPLRFLTPLIWASFTDKLADYDVIISSASWYITKGFGSRKNLKLKLPIEFCYCHTPPRWLYGYDTSVNFKKYLPLRIYALIIGHFLRMYDYRMAQKVNFFIANSKNVANRIDKFYRRDSIVIYPPVALPILTKKQKAKSIDKNYYFIVSRIVGGKGLEMAVNAAKEVGFKLKIAGSSVGYYLKGNSLIENEKNRNIEFLGQVTDEELVELFINAKAFLALARQEDFGITPVEAMLCGTPVIAFNGGGYKETVVNNKTGILFDDYSKEGLLKAIELFEKTKINPQDCIKQAEKFSKEKFKREIRNFIELKSQY